jgi:hypothetical protein
MSITINDHCMSLDVSGAIIATAARCKDGQWNVTAPAP